MHRSSTTLILAAALVALAGPAYAQKTFNQAKANAGGVTPGDAPGFPVTISQKGHYKLIGNLTVPDANTTAIQVTADNVTIDLNGFGIFGPGAVGTGRGVSVSAQSNVTVINGSVRGMGGNGIDLGGNSHRAEKVYAMLNGRTGIVVGEASLVSGNTANFNGDDGIATGFGCTVLGNTAAGNGDLGLRLQSNVGYANNVLTGNNGGGGPQVLSGIQMGGNVCNESACP